MPGYNTENQFWVLERRKTQNPVPTMGSKIPHNKLSGFFILIFWWPRITCHIKSWDPTTKRLNEKNPSAYYGWWVLSGIRDSFSFTPLLEGFSNSTFLWNLYVKALDSSFIIYFHEFRNLYIIRIDLYARVFLSYVHNPKLKWREKIPGLRAHLGYRLLGFQESIYLEGYERNEMEEPWWRNPLTGLDWEWKWITKKNSESCFLSIIIFHK